MENLISKVDEDGKMVLDLTKLLRLVLVQKLQANTASTASPGSSETSSASSSSSGGPGSDFDPNRIDLQRWREIMRDPEQYIEFVYQNRRYKLKPTGTIEPVPKRIIRGEKGALFYWKDRDESGNELPMGARTKIYLKRYQKQQCSRGNSDRAQGLAGFVDGRCSAPQVPRRRRAAREPK